MLYHGPNQCRSFISPFSSMGVVFYRFPRISCLPFVQARPYIFFLSSFLAFRRQPKTYDPRRPNYNKPGVYHCQTTLTPLFQVLSSIYLIPVAFFLQYISFSVLLIFHDKRPKQILSCIQTEFRVHVLTSWDTFVYVFCLQSLRRRAASGNDQHVDRAVRASLTACQEERRASGPLATRG